MRPPPKSDNGKYCRSSKLQDRIGIITGGRGAISRNGRDRLCHGTCRAWPPLLEGVSRCDENHSVGWQVWGKTSCDGWV